MPNIGEISKASAIGYKGTGLFHWVACPDCGKEGWRPLSSEITRCWTCGARARQRKICPITYNGGEPRLGDTSTASQLNYKGRSIYIYVACPECKTERWVRKVVKDELCIKCCAKGIHQGELSGRWKGGIKKSKGYIYVTLPKDDPMYSMVAHNRKVAEHRLVMARKLGRPLSQDDVVHHINGKKNDNKPENLQLLTYHTHHPLLTYQATQNRLQGLETRVLLLESENILLRSMLQGVRDSVPDNDLKLQRYNTPSTLDCKGEGIVHTTSNDRLDNGLV